MTSQCTASARRSATERRRRPAIPTTWSSRLSPIRDLIPEPERVVSEMRRVTRTGGVVACGTFDCWGGFSADLMLTDTGAPLDEGLRTVRDFLRSRPLVRPDAQAQLWRQTGLKDVV